MTVKRTDLPWWQRLAQRFASSRVGSWLFSHTLHHIDRVLMGLSGGRVSIPRVLAGVPVIRLTTTGAKSGKERTVPVLGMRDGEDWIVVASNWGDDRHPAWYHNLTANPSVTVTHEDRSEAYVAREATGAEYDEYWAQANDMYVGFEPYDERSGDRAIPIVVLEPPEA
jgi:deazaflavin-dependent oxidoreductase (nitroreductase family)